MNMQNALLIEWANNVRLPILPYEYLNDVVFGCVILSFNRGWSVGWSLVYSFTTIPPPVHFNVLLPFNLNWRLFSID